MLVAKSISQHCDFVRNTTMTADFVLCILFCNQNIILQGVEITTVEYERQTYSIKLLNLIRERQVEKSQ